MNATKRFRPAEPLDDGSIIPLAEHHEYRTALAALTELEQLHAQKLADRKRLIMRAQGTRVRRSASQRAADLLRGGKIDAIPVGAQIAALDEELDVIRGAIIEKSRDLDVVARDAAYEESMKLQPEFFSSMRDALIGIQATLAAFNKAAAIAGQLQAAGYRVSSTVMPDLMPHGLRQVQTDGLAQFKRALAEMGAL